MKKVISCLLVVSVAIIPVLLHAQVNEDSDRQSEIDDPCVAAQKDAADDTFEILWIAAGCLFGCLGVGAAYLIETSPPAMTLVGKSPDYVARYTDCYRKEARWLQTHRALAGCIVSGALYLTYNLLQSGLFYIF